MIDIEVSDLELYFGDDYIVNDNIIIHQPTISELIKCERDYFSVIYTLCAISSDMKSQLWDIGLDWNTVEDFQLFCMLAPTLSKDRTSILFGDLDFSEMKTYQHPHIDDEIVLTREEVDEYNKDLIAASYECVFSNSKEVFDQYFSTTQ